MVSDCGPGYKQTWRTYQLEERDGVILRKRMQRERDNVLSGGGKGV